MGSGPGLRGGASDELEAVARERLDQLGAFVKYEGGDVLDASLALLPPAGQIVPNDPRWQWRTAVEDSLVYRYDPNASPDGLPGSEGTFSLRTFPYVDALARSGRLDNARLTLSKMLTYANHIGLYAEETDPTGQQVGNLPQAFAHLALIAAVLNPDRELDNKQGPVIRRPEATRRG
jgi:GH15 family glucan-1,4-alpha-glucosidase